MSKALLIAEKPSVARDIQAIYNKHKGEISLDIDFTNARGHLLSLIMPGDYKEEWGKPWTLSVLPIIPEDWKTSIVVPDVYGTIKKLVKDNSYDYIINACDTAREGELIFYRIYEKLGIKTPVLRFWTDDLSEPSVLSGLNSLKDSEEFSGLHDAADLRSYFDWLIGINFSRAATLKTKTKMSIGRVETPTLAMIVNREREIENFIPKDYFDISCTFDGKGAYQGLLYNEDNKVWNFDTKEEAEKILETIKAHAEDGVIEKVTRSTEKVRPLELHNLTELQKESARLYGFSPDKTLSLAQSLYEKHKVLSYPRTDSRYITKNLAKEIEKHLSAIADINLVKDSVKAISSGKARISRIFSDKRFVDDSKINDHYALIPTQTHADLSKLTEDEKKVFLLVVRRFVGMFMDDNINDKVSVTTKVDDYRFVSNGKTVKEEGWKVLFEEITTKDTLLPPLDEGEPVHVTEGNILEKQTKPPARYAEDTILDAMETCGKFLDDEELKKVLKSCKGLGTSATRAEILEKLVRNEWVTKEKGKGKSKVFIPTEFGKRYIDALSDTTIVSPELTATWEKKLKDVENNTLGKDNLYEEMKAYITSTTEHLSQDLSEMEGGGGGSSSPIGECPICKRTVFSGVKSYYCEGYKSKACTFAFSKNICQTNISEKDAKDLLTKGETRELDFTWKSGKKSRTKLVIKEEDGNLTVGFPSETVVGSCPICNSDVLVGAKSYYCRRFKDTKEDGSHVCSFAFSRTISGTPITEEDARDLLTKGETKEKSFTWKSGKKSRTKLIVGDVTKPVKQPDGSTVYEKTGEIGVVFPPFSVDFLGECPVCKTRKVKVGPNFFVCEGYKSDCSFAVKRSVSGAVISPEEAKKMIYENGSVTKELTFKNGSTATKELTFDPVNKWFSYKKGDN